MSTFEYNPEKGTGKFTDVVFLYTKMKDPTLKFQSKTEYEYTTDFVVDKATAKQFKKAFPKNSVREVDQEDFEGIYKIPAPTDDDEIYVLKLKARAQYKDKETGELKTIPDDWKQRAKVFKPVDGGVEDITTTTLIANGSKGNIAFSTTSSDFGVFPRLSSMLVTDLIEYEAAGGGSEWGDVVNTPEPKASGIDTSKEDVPASDDFDEDPVPF